MTNFEKPDWLDSQMYPFKHNFIQLQSGKMHYLDKGAGDVLLFVHGTPTWSFLYRKYIEQLSKNYRCIAIDHIGFGLSEKPKDLAGTPQFHAKNLAEFIEKLGLQNITLVVHDFGGPIGLGAAITMPEKIKQIVLFNSWLWEIDHLPAIKKADKLINSWLGKVLYLRLNFSPKVLIKQGIADKRNMSKAIHRHYLKPFPDKNSRQSLLAIAKSLAGSSHWYQEQWQHLGGLSQKPWLILWGEQDKFFEVSFLEKWESRIPHALVRRFDCGHFVQEERAQETIEELRNFMEGFEPSEG